MQCTASALAEPGGGGNVGALLNWMKRQSEMSVGLSALSKLLAW